MMEIYLTKMILNPKCPQARRDLGNPQELHRTVSKGFPESENQEHLPKHLRETPRNRFDILHRLDIDKNRGRAILLIQSAVNPDWAFLPRDYADEIKQKSVHEQYGQIENGMVLMFRLQANPTKRVPNRDEKAHDRFKDSKKRRRVEIIGDENESADEKRIKWLQRKGEEAGFKLTNVEVAPIPNVTSVEKGKLYGRKTDEKVPDKTHRLTFGSVVFEGVLQVADAAKFREALQKGIGSGKAYGFGLLSVAPVNPK